VIGNVESSADLWEASDILICSQSHAREFTGLTFHHFI
jgi:hypothetical protein